VALLLVGVIASPGTAASAAAPLPQQWWFNTWRVENGIWPLSKGDGVTVAILDTGVEADLPGLSGSILPGADLEYGRGDGRRDMDEQPDRGHGTGMASLIVSQGGPTGFLGVAPGAKILPLVTQSSAVYTKGIRYAVDRGAKVINLSQGVPGICPQEMQDAVSYAIKRDAIVVASAGNSGHEENGTQYPSNCKGVLAVGAAGANLKPFYKSQRQPYVAVAAPGTGVGSVIKDGQFHTSEGGTSSAAALTSGAIALIRSKFPQMSNREVVRQLIASATDIGPEGRDDESGAGMIQPRRVLQGAVPKNSANPVFEEYDKLGAESGGESQAPQSSGGPGANMGNVIGLAVVGTIGAILLIVVFFVNRRRRPAAMGPMQGGMMPPGFGAPPQQPPYPGPPQTPMPQGQPPYPPQGPPQGQPPYGPPPQQQGYRPQGGGEHPQ
jgi:subtilisin family serine protease